MKQASPSLPQRPALVLLSQVIGKLYNLANFYRNYIRSFDELNSMRDHELSDLGLARGVLNQVALQDARSRTAS